MLTLSKICPSRRPGRLGLTLVALVVGVFLSIVPHLPFLGIVLIVVALLERAPRRVTHVLLILALLTIPAIPWLHRYQPVLSAAPDCDCEMRWPTQPSNWLASVRKYSRAFWKRKRCDYHVLGWSADGLLYYRETCKDKASLVWAYNPERGNHPRQVETGPADLTRETISQRATLGQIRSPRAGSFSAAPPRSSRLTSLVTVMGNLEPTPRFCLLWPVSCDFVKTFVPDPCMNCCGESVKHPAPCRGVRVVSPDSRWVALTVRYPHGPEDIIVLSVSDSEQDVY
jgi:hypothetical protein